MTLFALLIALAQGWEAKVHFTHDPRRSRGGDEGVIHVRGGEVRIEEPTPLGDTVVLYDGRHLWVLFPARREFLQLPVQAAPRATVPPLSLAGMRKVGGEVLRGQRCDIWERRAGDVLQRLWVPAGKGRKKKLFFFLRQVTRTPAGGTQADLTGLRFQPQPDKLFRVPAGYRPTSR